MGLKLLGISGSLRKASTNTGLLRAFSSFADSVGFDMTILDYQDVPMYNQDVEDCGNPESVDRVRLAISEADGIVFACPEYNGYFSAALKNLIDWGTRKTNVWAGKRFMIVTAGGGGGGSRGQKQLVELMGNIKGVFVDVGPVNVKIFGHISVVNFGTGDVTDSEIIAGLGDAARAFVQT